MNFEKDDTRPYRQRALIAPALLLHERLDPDSLNSLELCRLGSDYLSLHSSLRTTISESYLVFAEPQMTRL